MRSYKIQPLFFVALSMLTYYLLQFSFPTYGSYVIYPIKITVTMLHEFGHAMAAVITGGTVKAIQINSNGSGWCETQGGLIGVVLMGGYLGSAIFGNMLLYVGYVYPSFSKYMLYILSAIMFIIATVWSASLTSTALVIPFLVTTFLLGKYAKRLCGFVIMTIGALSVSHVIFDYKVGPSSDLAKYAEIWPFLSQKGWMYVWLVFVVAITWVTINRMKKEKSRLQSKKMEYLAT